MCVQNLSLPFPTFSEVFTLFLSETHNLFELGKERWHRAGEYLAQHGLHASMLAPQTHTESEEAGLESCCSLLVPGPIWLVEVVVFLSSICSVVYSGVEGC